MPVRKTFFSFDEEEIQEQIDFINKTMEEYKNMTDEEKKKNTKSPYDLLSEVDEPEK